MNSVYFVECSGRIKIGFSSKVEERMKQIATTAPAELKLLATIEGSIRLEKAIHRHLAEHRLTREWFRDCQPVRETIGALVALGPSVIGFVEREPVQRMGGPSALQLGLSSMIKQKKPYGVSGPSFLADRIGVSEPVAKHRLSNRSAYSLEDIRALFKGEDGLDFVRLMMGEATPKWWKPVRQALAKAEKGASDDAR
jgi:hypothetical protein